MTASPQQDLLEIFQAALNRVSGAAAVRAALQEARPSGPQYLVAVGKAAQAMAEGAAEVLGPDLAGGLLISKPGHLDLPRLQQLGLRGIEGAHPLPNATSLAAGAELAALLEGLGPGQPLLFLISGGASSLVELPVPGIGLEQLQRINRWLLGSGLAIGEINLVRKSISAIKAGGLAARLGGRPALALLISDVPGDDPGAIGSGLLVPDPELAVRVRALELPDWLRELVELGLAERARLPAPVAPELQIVACLDDARRAAAARARELGYAVQEHAGFRGGEAEQEGALLARQLLDGPAGVQVWGGEPVVRLPPEPGRGGRNQQLALAVAREIAGRTGVYFLSAGTDGGDGPTDDAGALVDAASIRRGTEQGLDPGDCLAHADAGRFHAASGDLVNTGPTGTNVMDLMLGLKLDQAGP